MKKVEVIDNGCTDTSSCYEVSTVGIAQNSTDNFKIYPNPNSGSFTVDLGKSSVSSNIKLLTLQGQILLEMKTEKKQVIEIESNQAKGIYLIQISNETGVVTKKMVIE